jgi:ribonuclease HI
VDNQKMARILRDIARKEILSAAVPALVSPEIEEVQEELKRLADIIASDRLKTPERGARAGRQHLRCYFDGASRGNPGPSGIGVIITGHSGRVLLELSEPIGSATNNVAEYQGLIRALEASLALGGTHVDLYSDSQLLVNQMTGSYRVKEPTLIALHEQAIGLLRHFRFHRVHHVVRALNAKADKLANEGIDSEKSGRLKRE